MQAFPYSEAEVIRFLRQQAPELLAHLAPTQRPFWGRLTAPLMVAHLTEWVGRSAGRDPLPLSMPAAYFEHARYWLLSAAPLAHYPELPRLPAPLGPNAALASAVAEFQQALDDFFDYYARHPAATHAHPAFGPLTFGQWLVMHFKHFNHHLMQFGLLPESLLPQRRAGLLLPGSSSNPTSIPA
jgi:hypothetical protein